MANKRLKSIIRLTDKLKKDMESVLPRISSEVDAIISEKGRDIKRIEGILDILLDCGQMGVGKAEFRKLNKYYASFNAENANFYADAYDGMPE